MIGNVRINLFERILYKNWRILYLYAGEAPLAILLSVPLAFESSLNPLFVAFLALVEAYLITLYLSIFKISAWVQLLALFIVNVIKFVMFTNCCKAIFVSFGLARPVQLIFAKNDGSIKAYTTGSITWSAFDAPSSPPTCLRTLN